MKINYNNLMEEEIKKLNYKPKLLLHACCGVCSSSVLERLIPYFDISVLFYNPNIFPFTEYKRRLETQEKLLNNYPSVKLINLGHLNEDFEVKGLENENEGGARCKKCFYIRLKKTALYSKENNFDYFTTTLSVSPHKDSEVLNKLGKNLEDKYNIKYLYSDFKKKEGYKRSTQIANELNLYKQIYCGCKYSRRKVGIDIDDVIANTKEGLLPLMLEYDKTLRNNGIINENGKYFSKFDWSNEEKKYFRENYLEKHFDLIEPIENARDFIQRLYDDGFEIIYVTARKTKYENSYKWLCKYNFPCDKLIMNASDKGDIVLDEKIEYFIDDDIRNLKCVLEKTKAHVIGFNTKEKDFLNASSWEEVYKLIKGVI